MNSNHRQVSFHPRLIKFRKHWKWSGWDGATKTIS